MNLADYIRDVADFPKPGISFKDITPLLGDGAAFRHATDAMAELTATHDLRPDVCAGPEARGFVFGSSLAYRLGIGLIPIRKPGKLPSDTMKVEYELEYGTDTIEMHVDAVKPGQRVLLIDDLLATGGTMRACIDLVEKAGATVAGVLCTIELTFLDGRKKLGDYPIFSLITY